MNSEEPNRFVIFKLHNEEYGVNVLDVKEIAKPLKITKIPNSPDYIEGVFNLRGTLTPLINLRNKFGLDQKEIDVNTRIVIAELDDQYVGVLVDEASEVVKIPFDEIQKTPDLATSKISDDFLQGVGKVADRLIILLRLDHIITKAELDKLNELKNKEQKTKKRKKE